jgi:hypothetical protein
VLYFALTAIVYWLAGDEAAGAPVISNFKTEHANGRFAPTRAAGTGRSEADGDWLRAVWRVSRFPGESVN